jgi:hypothetical protein
MKTAKIYTAITILSFVLFFSLGSSANSGISNTGDLPKSGTKNVLVPNTANAELNYLRFDVNKYINESEEDEFINNAVDYLHFDVTNFIDESEAEITELPVSSEFEYLRFDVNNFIPTYSGNLDELPANEFDYLRFDVNNFETPAIEELPIAE